MTNPGPLNIEGRPLTQLELVRVPESQLEFADSALREIERRLLGEGRSDPRTEEEAMVWAATATYLSGRLQGVDAQKPGRQPDMSAKAAEAMQEVLQQLQATLSKAAYADNRTEMLDHLLDKSLATDGTSTSALDGTYTTDAQIGALANKMGATTPVAGPWLRMLCQVVEQLPFCGLHHRHARSRPPDHRLQHGYDKPDWLQQERYLRAQLPLLAGREDRGGGCA